MLQKVWCARGVVFGPVGRVAGVLALAAASAARATDLIDIQTGALDQPQINVIIRSTGFTGTPLSYSADDFLTGLPTTYYNVPAYFDTGASSILLSSDTSQGWGIATATNGGTPIYFNDVGSTGVATFNVSVPVYLQLAPYSPNTTTDDPAHLQDYTQNLGPVRAQVGPVQTTTGDELDDLIAQLSGGGVDVVGMPAMKGKVVVVDPSRVDNFDMDAFLNAFTMGDSLPDIEARTYLYDKTPANVFHPATADTNPGIPNTNRHVKLTMSNFASFTSVSPAGAAGPDLAENPFIGRDPVLVAHELTHGITPPANATPGVKMTLGNKSVEGNFLLDSGAATSFISSAKAAQLGITVGQMPGTDDLGNPTEVPFIMLNGVPLPAADQFTLPVGGVSGQATVAGFYLDSLLLRTTEGDPNNDNDPAHLRFLHAPIAVSDISLSGQDPFDPSTILDITLDGVLGMNFFIASADFSGDILSGGGFGATSTSNFDWMTFDFSDMNNALLGLDLKPEFVPEPASLGLMGVGAVALLRRRKR